MWVHNQRLRPRLRGRRASHGFRVMVVREAVGDRNPAAHRQSMLDMQAKYADIVTLDTTIEYLAGA